MRRLRRNLGEDASTLGYFFTKRRGGNRMAYGERQGTMAARKPYVWPMCSLSVVIRAYQKGSVAYV